MYLYRYIIHFTLYYIVPNKNDGPTAKDTHTYLHIGLYGEMDREKKSERERAIEINVKRKRAKSVRVSFEYIIKNHTRM